MIEKEKRKEGEENIHTIKAAKRTHGTTTATNCTTANHERVAGEEKGEGKGRIARTHETNEQSS